MTTIQNLFTKIPQTLVLLAAVVLSLSIHEYSHAYVATKLGDPTPKQEGRLSLNPLHHIDFFGFLMMVLVHFGWAKPVRVNPMYFSNPKKGMMFTAIAGPISNLILCVLSSLLYFVSYVFSWHSYVMLFFLYMTLLNVGLAVFNLIPIYPLDGSRVLNYFVPRYASFSARYGNYIMMGFWALLLLPMIGGFPDVFGTVIGTVQQGTMTLLLKLWSLSFGFFLK